MTAEQIAGTVFPFTGTVTDGVDDVQTFSVTVAPAEGHFKLSLGDVKTGFIEFDWTAAQWQAALEAHAGIGVGNVIVTGGPLSGTPADIVVTCRNKKSGLPLGAITVTDATTLLDGPEGSAVTITVTATATGVKGTGRGLPPGAILWKTDTGAAYANLTGTVNKPVWTALEESLKVFN